MDREPKQLVLPAIVILIIIALAIIQSFISVDMKGLEEILSQVTGTIFAGTIVVAGVALFLWAALFFISQGNLRILARVQFWFIFGVTIVVIGALTWAVFRLVQVNFY